MQLCQSQRTFRGLIRTSRRQEQCLPWCDDPGGRLKWVRLSFCTGLCRPVEQPSALMMLQEYLQNRRLRKKGGETLVSCPLPPHKWRKSGGSAPGPQFGPRLDCQRGTTRPGCRRTRVRVSLFSFHRGGADQHVVQADTTISADMTRLERAIENLFHRAPLNAWAPSAGLGRMATAGGPR